jgi:hypothetical protein
VLLLLMLEDDGALELLGRALLEDDDGPELEMLLLLGTTELLAVLEDGRLDEEGRAEEEEELLGTALLELELEEEELDCPVLLLLLLLLLELLLLLGVTPHVPTGPLAVPVMVAPESVIVGSCCGEHPHCVAKPILRLAAS